MVVKKYKLDDIKEEVKSLDLKQDKDYCRFKTIRSDLQQLYKNELVRGRYYDYEFIREKEYESFENYSSQGYEYYESFKEHFDKYYLDRDFKNFEQEQYMYNDLALQYKRRRIFNL